MVVDCAIMTSPCRCRRVVPIQLAKNGKLWRHSASGYWVKSNTLQAGIVLRGTYVTNNFDLHQMFLRQILMRGGAPVRWAR
jgi:hypothetical protein